jgi:hypothetical protein
VHMLSCGEEIETASAYCCMPTALCTSARRPFTSSLCVHLCKKHVLACVRGRATGCGNLMRCVWTRGLLPLPVSYSLPLLGAVLVIDCCFRNT